MSEGEYYGFEHSTMQYVHSSTGNDDPSDLPAYTSPIVIENVIFATPEEISSVGYEAFPDELLLKIFTIEEVTNS